MQRQHETVETGPEDHSMALVPDEAGKLGSLAGDGAFPQGVACQKHSESWAFRIYEITGITEFPNPSF
jgi:DUF1009 family protein